MTSLQVVPASSQAPTLLFAAAADKLNEIRQMLTSKSSLAADAASVERDIRPQGAESMRLLYEDHLDLRCSANVAGPVGNDALQVHRDVRTKIKRELMTMFGKVTIWRPVFEGRGLLALHPHEAALNFPNNLYSLEVQKESVVCASGQSFDAAGEALEGRSAAHLPKRQFQAEVRASAQDFWSFYNIAEFNIAPKDTGAFLVMSADHEGVTLIRRDLTASTQKRAKESPPLHDTRNGKGQKNNKKRMATVAAVYTVAPYSRMAQ